MLRWKRSYPRFALCATCCICPGHRSWWGQEGRPAFWQDGCDGGIARRGNSRGSREDEAVGIRPAVAVPMLGMAFEIEVVGP